MMSRGLSTTGPAVKWDERVARALVALAGGVRRLATFATFAEIPLVPVTFPTVSGVGCRADLKLSVLLGSFASSEFGCAPFAGAGREEGLGLLVSRVAVSVLVPGTRKSTGVSIPRPDNNALAAALGSWLECVGLDSAEGSAVDRVLGCRLWADPFGRRVTGASASGRSCGRWGLPEPRS